MIRTQSGGTNWKMNRQPTKATQLAFNKVNNGLVLKQEIESGRKDQKMFKMKKFKNVNPRTNTHNGGLQRVFSAA